MTADANPARPITVVGAHVQGLVLQVERIPREGETVMAWAFGEAFDGGKSSNQAVAAARLGAPVVLVSAVGSDARGRRALAAFAAEGIDVRFCLALDGPTDVGFILLPPSRIPAIATALERNRELSVAAVEHATNAIRSSFCVLCALEALQPTVLAAFRIARAAGVTTILNPSPSAPLDPALVELTDVLIPNEHEAAAIADRDGTPDELANELARGLAVPHVVVTAGQQGAFVATGSAVTHVPAPEVSVVDTTGAGDAFAAALAVRLREGESVLDAARFAVSVASISVQRAGTMPAFPRLSEL